jgi:hypothetical protein
VTSDRICATTPISIADLPSEKVLFVLAEVTLQGVDIADPNFALVFTTAVLESLKSLYPNASVTILTISQKDERRAADVVVTYRVEVPKSSAVDEAAVAMSVADATSFSKNIRMVGASVSGSNAYAAVVASFATTPEVVSNTKSSSSSNNSLIIGVVVGGIFFLILVLLVLTALCSSSKSSSARSRHQSTKFVPCWLHCSPLLPFVAAYCRPRSRTSTRHRLLRHAITPTSQQAASTTTSARRRVVFVLQAPPP